MIKLTVEEVAFAAAGKVSSGEVHEIVSGFSVDSRTIKKGETEVSPFLCLTYTAIFS